MQQPESRDRCTPRGRWRVFDDAVSALLGPAGVLVIATIGVVVVLQGWRSRIPNFDMVTTIDAAQQLIDHGHLPDRGVLTSFMSFTPPGAAWLMAPGVLLLRDPRLFEYVGSLVCYVGTLFGIFLLARMYFGGGCAILATVLYAFSEFGVLAGASVWQRYPIHCFAVWTVYWLANWVVHDSPKWLAVALVTWALGMYVFMEMAPAILLVPVLWFVFRPRIRIVPLLVSLLLVAVVWYPYLRFESARGFVDVQSQVRRERIHTANLAASWCNAAAMPGSWLREASHQNATVSKTIRSRWMAARQWTAERVGLTVDELLLANFSKSRILGGPTLLLLLTVIGVIAAMTGDAGSSHGDARAFWRRRLTLLAIAMALLGLVSNEIVLAGLLSAKGRLSPSSVLAIRMTQVVLLVIASVLILGRSWIAATIDQARARWANFGPSRSAMFIAVAALVPWLLLFLVSDSERRYWWIWPLQVIPLAAAVTYVPRRLHAPRWTVWLASIAVVVLVGANTVLFDRMGDWVRHGWSGHDAVEVEIADHLARRMTSAGEHRTAISYEIEIWQFMALFNVVDPRYKAGADFDLVLRYRHGIENVNKCAEGVSPGDEFRIVQVRARDTRPAARNRVEVSRSDSVRLVDRVGPYEIYQRL